ncbi:MAG TPA: metalloregulator ArsR/SmtB family transcription factor [Pyrinomonadaceae bacterium]|jgi:DNA-binding transcriptional ArsR family regulator|nr:metalloregulator ArsR/SmtB family transcription factor [Pyrinomonadaceae bacterium]
MNQITKTSRQADIDAFTAIAHPARRQILDLLAVGESSVQNLAEPFEMSRPAVSQHLRVLLDVGLVEVRRSGREQRYRLRAERLEAVYDWVAHYTRFWEEKLDNLGKYLEENE